MTQPVRWPSKAVESARTALDGHPTPRNGRTRWRVLLAAACGAIAAVSALADEPAARPNRVEVIAPGHSPRRVHVVEDYETDIEKRWWLRGELEMKNTPPSRSRSVPNRRAGRAVETLNFDRKMGDRTNKVKGVIFNPVPGPPMGKNSRLSFRYWLKGSDTIKVQIYSLSKGYHRYLTITGLPQGTWQSATVDMTEARRPDGSGGPLSEDERIDDIQFYVSPSAELLIDDILLYDAAADDETRPFPRRVIFTGWFDTGKQGKEWPGDFDIVAHEKPLTWKAAQSAPNAPNKETGKPWIRVHLRGRRELSNHTAIRFRYKLVGSKSLRVVLSDSNSETQFDRGFSPDIAGEWAAATIDFRFPIRENAEPLLADEVRFLIDKRASLQIDDLLIYEPENKSSTLKQQPRDQAP